MSNELLDMTVRKNFDLLTIPDAYGVTEQEQVELRENCQKVVTTFRKTVFNLCVMGAQLEAIKRSGTWKYVSDDKHSTFQYRKFSDFVNYVFGFSETRTSNLMSLAKYVIEDDGEYAFINPRYQDFNESQLIEMSTLETWEKQKIQSNMTVADIRLCKKYMKSTQYVADKLFPGFDLMTCARSWEEKEEAKKQAKADTAPDILPGQMGIEEIVPDPISEMASDGDEVQDEPKYITEAREKAHAAGIPFYEGDAEEFNPYVYDGKMSVEDYKLMHELREESEPTNDDSDEYEPNEGEVWQGGGLDLDEDEEDEAYEDMQGDMQTIEEENERSIVFAEPDVPLPPIDVLAEEEESPKYDFSSRDKIREFLYGYKSWEKCWELCYVLKVYCHEWANGMRIYAVEYAMKATLEQDEAKTIVRYFWKTTGQAFEIAKEQLWKYIATHKDEL